VETGRLPGIPTRISVRLSKGQRNIEREHEFSSVSLPAALSILTVAGGRCVDVAAKGCLIAVSTISVSDKRFGGVFPLTRIDANSRAATFPLSFNSLSVGSYHGVFFSVRSLRTIIQAGSQRFHSGGLPHHSFCMCT
jgi:hypothetical protein